MKISCEREEIKNITPVYNSNSELFRIWRKFDAGCAFFSTLALVSATLDYETNYPGDRTYSNCHDNFIRREGFRYTTLLLTLLSIFFTILRFIYKSLWIQTMQRLNNIKWSPENFSDKIFVQKRNLALEILLLLIIPYPGMNINVSIPLRVEEETRITCYTLAELFYCVMFFRCFFIIRSISNYSNFQDEWARMGCKKYNTKPGFSFAFKCLLKTQPAFMISLLFMMVLFFTAIIYRVLERPLDEFSTFYNSDPFIPLWFIFESMSTVGFGDIFPITYFGRTVSVFAFIVGAAILSLLIVKLQDVTTLNNSQKQVFERVSLSKTAAAFIKAGIRFYLAKLKYRPGHPVIFRRYFELRKVKKEFSRIKAMNLIIDFSMSESIFEIKNNISTAHKQLKDCKTELDRCIELVKSL